MLKWLLEQRDAVTLVLADVPSVKGLSLQQWATATHLIATLQPFMDVTKLLCADRYPTSSMIIPVLDELKNLLQSSTGGLDVLQSIFVRLLEDTFGDVFADIAVCCDNRRPAL